MLIPSLPPSSWITTRTRSSPWGAAARALAAAQARGTSAGDVRAAASALLLGLEPEDRSPPGDESPEAARRALATVLASPLAQVG